MLDGEKVLICNNKTVKYLQKLDEWKPHYGVPEDIFRDMYIVGYLKDHAVAVCNHIQDDQVLVYYYKNSLGLKEFLPKDNENIES